MIRDCEIERIERRSTARMVRNRFLKHYFDGNKNMRRTIKSIALLGLMTAATAVVAQPPRGGGRGPDGRGPQAEIDRGGPDGGEFGGRGPRDRGPGDRGPVPVKPGTVLPEFLVDVLKLDETQRASLAKLQATVDAELAKILTSTQQEQLKQIPQRGGPMGGPGREGGRPEGDRPEGQGRRPGRPEGDRPEGGARRPGRPEAEGRGPGRP